MRWFPSRPRTRRKPNDNSRTIVVQVLSNKGAPPSYLINEDVFAKTALEPKLAEIFASRSEKVMFVKGDPDLEYGKIAEVIDFGHQAGVDNIGTVVIYASG